MSRGRKRKPARNAREHNPPPSRHPATRRRLRGWAAAGLLVAGALLTFPLWRTSPPPVVTVDTTGFDPVIAAAIGKARDAVEGAPRAAVLRGEMGMVLLAHEVRAEARECFAQAMDLAPRDPRWPYFRGLAELVDDPMTAVTNLDRAVRLFPAEETAPRLKLADTLLSLGRFDEAEEHFRHVRDRVPDSAMAALGLGKLANARDQLPVAAGFLAEAATDPVTRKAAHRLLLTVNQRQGRSNEVDRIARSLAGLPNDQAPPDPFLLEIERRKTGEEAWINRADDWIKEGRAGEAARLLEKTIQTYPRSDRAMFFLGRARSRLGDAAGAEAILMRALELAPNSTEALLQLGVTRLGRGRPKEAQPCFRAAIKAKPNLAEAWFNLGLSLGADTERSECVAAFREAIRLRPNLAEAYLGLAVVLRADGQLSAAARELRHALELDPAEPLRRKILAQLEIVAPRGPAE